MWLCFIPRGVHIKHAAPLGASLGSEKLNGFSYLHCCTLPTEHWEAELAPAQLWEAAPEKSNPFQGAEAIQALSWGMNHGT